jgi:hypothetical protein
MASDYVNSLNDARAPWEIAYGENYNGMKEWKQSLQKAVANLADAKCDLVNLIDKHPLIGLGEGKEMRPLNASPDLYTQLVAATVAIDNFMNAVCETTRPDETDFKIELE